METTKTTKDDSELSIFCGALRAQSITYFNAEAVVLARVAVQKDISGLQVAVDDPLLVQDLHRCNNLLQKRTYLWTDRFYNRKWAK